MQINLTDIIKPLHDNALINEASHSGEVLLGSDRVPKEPSSEMRFSDVKCLGFLGTDARTNDGSISVHNNCLRRKLKYLGLNDFSLQNSVAFKLLALCSSKRASHSSRVLLFIVDTFYM